MEKTKILIVDDDINLLEGLKRSMRTKSDEWDITFLQSSRDAVDIINNKQFDVIVTDYKMPGLDGLELLSIVKEHSPGMKRILLTGQSESEVFESSKDIAHKYLSKPCPSAEIISSIESMLK